MSLKDLGPKLITITENEQKVYEAGKTAEWSAFWDDFQTNGTRTNYARAFYQVGWTDTTFRPKYDIKPTGTATNCFDSCKIVNLKECLAYNGVKIDITNCTSLYQFFHGSSIQTIGEFDMSVRTIAGAGVFQNCRSLRTIELLNIGETASLDSVSFQNCTELEEIRFAGSIRTSLSLQYPTKLSVDSMKNIISCLKNYAGTDKEATYTLTFNASCWATLEADSTAPDGGTWEAYVTSLGWNT